MGRRGATYGAMRRNLREGTSQLVTLAGPTPPPSTMGVGTNTWFMTGESESYWSGERALVTGIDWATAYGSPVAPGDLSATNIWNPTWLAELSIYRALRFMDWGCTNWSTQEDWVDRRLPTSPVNEGPWSDWDSWNADTNNAGVAYEWMIDVCNRTGKDLWICIPVKATEDYMAQLAALVLARLAPGLKVYLEFSNENWNGSFAQFQYCIDQGNAMPVDFTSLFSDQWRQGQGWAVWRSVKIWEAFAAAFGSAFATRCKRVYAYSGDYDIGYSAMSTILPNATWNPNGHTVDLLAIAPYFGGSLDGATATQADVRTAIDDVIADRFTAPLTHMAALGIPELGCYEGGQHCNTNPELLQGQPWMYDEYRYYLDQVKAQGVTLFMHYVHTGFWGGANGWGLKNDTNQLTADAPKYRAVIDWIAEDAA